MSYKLYQDDLPANLNLGSVVACDCEFTGLNPPKAVSYTHLTLPTNREV